MLCFAVLCCAMLCHAVLCCAVGGADERAGRRVGKRRDSHSTQWGRSWGLQARGSITVVGVVRYFFLLEIIAKYDFR